MKNVINTLVVAALMTIATGSAFVRDNGCKNPDETAGRYRTRDAGSGISGNPTGRLIAEPPAINLAGRYRERDTGSGIKGNSSGRMILPRGEKAIA